jgi:cytidylate kinase
MLRSGRQALLHDIALDLAARDERDRGRAEAPLRVAADALVLDTSDLDAAQAVAAAIALAERRTT